MQHRWMYCFEGYITSFKSFTEMWMILYEHNLEKSRKIDLFYCCIIYFGALIELLLIEAKMMLKKIIELTYIIKLTFRLNCCYSREVFSIICIDSFNSKKIELTKWCCKFSVNVRLIKMTKNVGKDLKNADKIMKNTDKNTDKKTWRERKTWLIVIIIKIIMKNPIIIKEVTKVQTED